MLNTDHPQSSAHAGSHRETLFGTAQYQVNLWHLDPQAVIDGDSAAAPGTRHQWLVVEGAVETGGSATDSHAFAAGQYLQTPSALRNPGAQPARLLEVCWGDRLIPCPLTEITEIRPWGSFTVLKDEPRFKLKQLMVKPGNRLSLQRHQQREEHWLITAGQPEITLDDHRFRLQAGCYIHIPRQAWHRITNPEGCPEPVEIVELQLGTYFGEDDIERKEDDYGRC